jgi:membrane protein DedA with SNARE-associated domain
MAQFVIETVTQWGYPGLIVLMLLESIFPPIPSELIIPFAGFAAATGRLSFFWVIAASSFGALLGVVPWYVAGRLFGLPRLRRLADRHGRWLTINAAELDTAVAWFERFGVAVVAFGRLLPLIRTLISVPAGLAAMPAPVFFAASLLGIVVWNTILTTAGYLLAEHYDLVEVFIDPLTWAVLAGTVGLYLFRFATWKPSGRG